LPPGQFVLLRENANAPLNPQTRNAKPTPPHHPTAGATGGFAAGEKGVKQFVRDGELQLRKEGQPGGNQSSPVALAFLLIGAGVGGGLLLNGVADFTEGEVKSEIFNVSGAAVTRGGWVLGGGGEGGLARWHCVRCYRAPHDTLPSHAGPQ